MNIKYALSYVVALHVAFFYLCSLMLKKGRAPCMYKHLFKKQVSRRSYAKFSNWVDVEMENMMISIVKVLHFIFPSMLFRIPWNGIIHGLKEMK